MIAVYPIGVPLLFLWTMLPYAAEFSDVPTRESEHAKGKHLAFFSMDYKGEYWCGIPMMSYERLTLTNACLTHRYWELVELGRKLVLNGFLVLCNQGTILQLAVALVVVLIHLLTIVRLQPMLHISNNSFYPYTTFMLFIVFFATILLQVETQFAQFRSVDIRAGYNKNLILVLLFGATIGVFLLGAYFLVRDIAQSYQHSLMCDDKGAVIQFRRLGVEAFYLFLSHTWATGQDQMQALKKELGLLVPSLKVFLVSGVKNYIHVCDAETNMPLFM
jgi:hypothetical protein